MDNGDPLRLLAVDTSVSWFSERVLVVWDNSLQHLGTLSTHNRSSTLSLAIGRSDDRLISMIFRNG